MTYYRSYSNLLSNKAWSVNGAKRRVIRLPTTWIVLLAWGLPCAFFLTPHAEAQTTAADARPPIRGLPNPAGPPPRLNLPELPRPLQQPTPDLLVPAPSPPLVEEELPVPPEKTFTISEFRFEGNTAFSASSLSEITRPFLGRPITFAELLQARSAITKHYVNNCYTTSGAYIPPQEAKNGIVTIRVLEGRVGEIDVTMVGKLKPGFVKARLAKASREPLNVPRLVEALQKLQVNPLIKTISAELSATPEPGVSILSVKAVTARSFYPAAIFDNGRNPQVGSNRRGVDLSDINFLGMGDEFLAGYRNTEGSDDIELTYSLPLNSYDGTLQLSYRNLTSKVIEEPLSALDITSDYQQYYLSFRQPLQQSLTNEFALGISLNLQQSRSLFLDGLPFPGRGVNNDGRVNVSTLGFSQDWIQRSEREVIALRSEVNLGLNAFGATTPFDLGVNPGAADSSFFFWAGQAQYLRILAPDTLLIARTDLQLADGPLASLEQFGLGGLGSVEGYRQNTLITDSGIFASVELRVPILRVPKFKALLQLIPFAEIGHGWDQGVDTQPSVNTLASVGMGVLLQLGQKVSMRLDYAKRLGEVPYVEGNTLQDDGIIYSVIYTP